MMRRIITAATVALSLASPAHGLTPEDIEDIRKKLSPQTEFFSCRIEQAEKQEPGHMFVMAGEINMPKSSPMKQELIDQMPLIHYGVDRGDALTGIVDGMNTSSDGNSITRKALFEYDVVWIKEVFSDQWPVDLITPKFQSSKLKKDPKRQYEHRFQMHRKADRWSKKGEFEYSKDALDKKKMPSYTFKGMCRQINLDTWAEEMNIKYPMDKPQQRGELT